MEEVKSETVVKTPGPLPKEVDSGALVLLEKAKALPVIERPDQYQLAGELVVKIREERKALKDRIVLHHKETKELAYRLHQGICEMERKDILVHDAGMAQMETLLLEMRKSYEAAVKKAAEDAAAEAEEKRLADEKLRKEEAVKQQTEFEDQQLETAVALEASGKVELAEHVLQTPPPPPEPPIHYGGWMVSSSVVLSSLMPKTSGLSQREAWEPVYENKLALIKAAAENPAAYAGYLLFNEKGLEALAKSLKGEARCPGVKFINNPKDVVNTKRKGK